jgi:hypothetical protein
MKKMRVFFEAWPMSEEIGSALPNQLAVSGKKFGSALPNQIIEHFLNLGFTNHYLIDESDDEPVLEKEIVKNIKDFMMSLGTGFTLIGSQFRLLLRKLMNKQ